MRTWWKLVGITLLLGCDDENPPLTNNPETGVMPVDNGALPNGGMAASAAPVPNGGMAASAAPVPNGGMAASAAPAPNGGAAASAAPVPSGDMTANNGGNGGAATGGDTGAPNAVPPGDGAAAPGEGPPGADPCAGAAGGDTHAAAAELLTGMATCGGSSCHAANNGRATLSLLGVTDLRAALVDRPACEAPSLPLIDGTGGGAALQRSWLWLKLTAEADGANVLMPDPAWGGPGTCGQPGDQPYGVLMPQGSAGLDEARLKPIRDWICSGAPGPGGA